MTSELYFERLGDLNGAMIDAEMIARKVLKHRREDSDLDPEVIAHLDSEAGWNEYTEAVWQGFNDCLKEYPAWHAAMRDWMTKWREHSRASTVGGLAPQAKGFIERLADGVGLAAPLAQDETDGTMKVLAATLFATNVANRYLLQLSHRLRLPQQQRAA